MELILKSKSKSKLDKVLALARELGISVDQRGEKTKCARKPGLLHGNFCTNILIELYRGNEQTREDVLALDHASC